LPRSETKFKDKPSGKSHGKTSYYEAIMKLFEAIMNDQLWKAWSPCFERERKQGGKLRKLV
jgi:hypothetical protein